MINPVLLIILDGWGINAATEGNAVAQADTPVLDKLGKIYPSTRIAASGTAVGLPKGQMGNSEVGHLNLGAGRVVYQNYTRINKAIDSGDFFDNPVLNNLYDEIKEKGSALHLMGLLSDGGVHSHIDHLKALVSHAKDKGLNRVYIHALMDGRDTPPRSGLGYIRSLEAFLKKKSSARIATVTGRFYAMDRDNRWDRVKEAYLTMTGGGKREAASAEEAASAAYGEGHGDEFIPPTAVADENGNRFFVQEGDGVIFFNFRSDRAREITRAFTEEKFDGFSGIKRPKPGAFACMTEYDESFGLPVLFSPALMDNLFGEIISKRNMRQLRIAETEKYAHVTFFFNGGEEEPYPGEERILIPSPRDVSTYDLKPEMSAFDITDTITGIIREKRFDLTILNFANGDMVGHTGSLPAAIKACRTVDICIGKIMDAAKEANCRVIITADHGNAEQMINPETGEPHTAHTSNPVPFILACDDMKGRSLRPGSLADVAPTILELFGILKPEQMDGSSLLIPI